MVAASEHGGMSMHHVGCAVASIEKSLDYYRNSLGFSRISKIVDISEQRVRVCFIQTAAETYIELIDSTASNSPIHNLLEKQRNCYHVAYNTNDVKTTVSKLEQDGFRLVSLFASEAFNGTPCAFLYTPDTILIELCTASSFDLL